MYSDDSDSTEISNPQTSGADAERKAEEEKTWKRQCLLNYRLGPGDIVQIQSRELNGRFQIVSGKHKGNPTSSWVTEIEFKLAAS